MNNKFLKKIEKGLKKAKLLITEQLSKFAKKDEKLKGDWDTQFPDIGLETTDDTLEDVAKKREEYERLLPIEFALEKKLQNISSALNKIKKGKYGVCEKCGKAISLERLDIIPETPFCTDCKNNK